MRFRLLASLAALALLAGATTAIAKVDQSGWPKVDVNSPQFKKQFGKGDVTYVGTPLSDKLLGHTGSDKIYGNEAADVIWGDWEPNNSKRQKDLLDGGPGDDWIYASRGRSTISGGDGNDFIKARDGRGTISCGPGTDIVKQSRKRRKNWKIDRDCEKISYTLDKKQT